MGGAKRRVRATQRGVTLVELVITIVIISIVAVGLLKAQAMIVQRSADPMLERQALAIAESYLEEITAKPFADPDSCPAVPGAGGRANFSAACHYHGLSGAPADQFGNALGLAGYVVNVSVGRAALDTIADTAALLVTVTVTDPLGRTLRLSAYRAQGAG